MAGLYLHIPFCRQACTYCDFHFSTALKNRDALVEALLREIAFYSSAWRAERFETVYLGGGTPSLLEEWALEALFQALYEHYAIAPEAEISLEANPDDLSLEYVALLQRLPVNRLSIGLQSFDEADLRFMNRAHSVEQALEALLRARQAGFENLSFDLIYGLPGRDAAHWERNLSQLSALQIPHFSAYALTVAPRTALAHRIQSGALKPPDEERQAEDFALLQDWSEAQGYEAYEISNYARPGFRALHNSCCWRGEPYLGIGPAAHSFHGDMRRWNVADNNRYIAAWRAGKPLAESEVLNTDARFNECVMTRLRTAEGLDLNELQTRFGAPYLQGLKRELQSVPQAYYQLEDDALKLSRAGRLYADGIAAQLFKT